MRIKNDGHSLPIHRLLSAPTTGFSIEGNDEAEAIAALSATEQFSPFLEDALFRRALVLDESEEDPLHIQQALIETPATSPENVEFLSGTEGTLKRRYSPAEIARELDYWSIQPVNQVLAPVARLTSRKAPGDAPTTDLKNRAK